MLLYPELYAQPGVPPRYVAVAATGSLSRIYIGTAFFSIGRTDLSWPDLFDLVEGPDQLRQTFSRLSAVLAVCSATGQKLTDFTNTEKNWKSINSVPVNGGCPVAPAAPAASGGANGIRSWFAAVRHAAGRRTQRRGNRGGG